MIKVNIFKQSNYPISAVKVKKFLQNFFLKHGIISNAEVNVAFVDEKKMKNLGKKYYPKDNNIHNVFSFVESEVNSFKNIEQDFIFLGEIIVCFPIVVKEANIENKLIEQKIFELIEHSGMHLLGIHHKE